MNPNQEQKLKALISSSPILNATERQEWLALLELMNDKQLGELEKILVLNQSAVNGMQQTAGQTTNKQVSNLTNQNTANKQPTTNNSVTAPEKQLPHLSHIMNLPKHWSDQAGKQLTKQIIKPLSNQTLQKTKFSTKLKNIFAEKELTTPKSTYQLEITDHSEVNLSKPQPKKPDLSEIKVKDVVVPALIPVPAKNIPQPPVEVIKPVWKPQNTSGVSKDKFIPGVNFEKSVQKTNLENIENIKQHVKETQGERKNTTINLNELSDLQALTMSYIKSCDFASLLAKVKQLVVKFGYFEVLFNIELSKVYKSYVATGLNLMSESGVTTENVHEEILQKEDFEKIADLLYKIQAN